MLLAEKIVVKLIVKIQNYVTINRHIIKFIERLREIYIYPNKMMGRKFKDALLNNENDILVFAAHPDDDILGLGSTLYRYSVKEENIKVVFVTNGTAGYGESWYLSKKTSYAKAELRYHEAVQALSLINIPKKNIFCLGFPDGGTQRYLKDISIDIATILKETTPKRIYVHCIEGGHIDHDITSFIVKTVCNKIEYPHLFEWTEYNPSQAIGTRDIKFLPSQEEYVDEVIINISEKERYLKRKMLALHKSQDVERHFMQGEAIRKANISKAYKELFEHCQVHKRSLQTIIEEYRKFRYFF